MRVFADDLGRQEPDHPTSTCGPLVTRLFARGFPLALLIRVLRHECGERRFVAPLFDGDFQREESVLEQLTCRL